MSAGLRRVGFVMAIGALVACSLTTDLTGLAESGEPAVETDAGSADVVADAVVPDVVAIDAVPPGCKPSTVIDAPLTTNLGTFSARSSGAAGYPKIEAFFGEPAAVLFPFVDVTPVPIDAGDPDAGPTFYVPPERQTSIAGIWQSSPVALRSFDLELEVQVRCTSAGSCADGLAVGWIAASSLNVLVGAKTGGAEGLPSGVDGMAVLLDNYQNEGPSASNDPPPPSLQLVKLDPAKVPGGYPWIVTSRSVPFLGAWHKLAVSVRGENVSVRYEGVEALTAKTVPIATGLIGITAATGGQTEAVAVRNFKGSFYDCTP